MNTKETWPNFNNYHVIRELGHGGMGIVYLAEDKRLNRKVALKVINAEKIHSISKEQIVSEAKILANLNHAHIVHLYDIIEEGDSIALVMEYVEGTDLKRALLEQTVSLPQKLTWLRQIAQALECAHNNNVLHRDLKPENILITNTSTAKLSDFGISEVISGTPKYSLKSQSKNKSEKFSSLLTLAPEEIQSRDIDVQSDLFSFGCVCYTLLCGKHPFVTGSTADKDTIIHNILHAEPIDPKEFNPDIPVAISNIVVRLLKKNKTERPNTAAEVIYELVQVESNPSGLSELDLTETLPTGELQLPKRHFPMWLKSILTLIVVLLCGIGGYIYSESRPVEKKYVAIYEPALWDSENLSDVEKDLYLSASVWIREYLLAHPNVSVLEAGVAEKPGVAIEDFFKQTAADEVITTQINCVNHNCNLSVRLIEGSSYSVVSEGNQRIAKDDRETIRFIIDSFLKGLYSRAEGYSYSENIDKESFDKYLTLYDEIYDGAHNVETALPELEKLHVQSSGFPGVYRLWLHVLLQAYYDTRDEYYLNEFDKVVAFEKQFIPSHPQIFEHEIQWLLRKKEYQSAYFLLSERESNEGLSEELISGYAEYYRSIGEHKEAAYYYEKLLILRPSLNNFLNSAVNYWWLSDFSRLDKTVEYILQIDDNHLLALKLLAASKLTQGELLEAQKLYKVLIEIKKDGEIYNNLGLSYLLAENYVDAEKVFFHARKILPNDPSILLNLAEVRLLLGKKGLAILDFEKILSVTSLADDAEFLRVRAQALAHIGKHIQAAELIRQLEKKYPDNSDIQYSAAIVYSLLGDKFSALTSAKLSAHNGLGKIWFEVPWIKSICNSINITNNTERQLSELCSELYNEVISLELSRPRS